MIDSIVERSHMKIASMTFKSNFLKKKGSFVVNDFEKISQLRMTSILSKYNLFYSFNFFHIEAFLHLMSDP